MAYDRYDTRDAPRDERSRWSEDRSSDRGRWRGDNRGQRDERGFWDRASDEVASWFGDNDADRRRRQDQMRDEGSDRERSAFSSRNRDYDRGYGRDYSSDRQSDRNWYETRGLNERGGFSERDYNPDWRRELSGPGSDRDRGFEDRERSYRPMTGDYGRYEQSQSRSEHGMSDYDRRGERWDSPWAEDEYRQTSRAGSSDWSDRSRHEDPNYHSWRQRHMDEIDRDYEDYRRENQSRFESDFGNWRQRREHKRGFLGQVREHMDVVGNDDQHVGKVDKVAGDRIILTKSDPESGGVHHSLSCSDINRVEGDKVVLDCSANEAKSHWRDESRSRALFEREDRGETGPHMLNRSFEGTYR